MMSEKKKKTIRRYIAMAFFVMLGAVCGYLLMMRLIGLYEEKPFYEVLLSFAGMLLIMYAASLFHLILHEAGHLLFGLLSGYKFSSFRIFSFMWIKENGKIKTKRLNIAGTAGQCLMTPPDVSDGRFPYALYNLGGAIMNIAVGTVCLGLSFAFKGILYLSDVMLIFAVFGYLYAIINGIPMRLGAVDNDGYNVYAMSESSEAMRAFGIQMKVNEQIARGVRLKDMPEEWFAVPSDEAMKNSMVAVIGVFACNRLMDSQMFEQADALMAHMLELNSGIVGLHRCLMVCDRMYIEMITQNRKDILCGMLDKEQKAIMKSMKNFLSVLRTEYVYSLLCDKDKPKADMIKLQFEKCAKTYPYQSDVQSERELIELAEKINCGGKN